MGKTNKDSKETQNVITELICIQDGKEQDWHFTVLLCSFLYYPNSLISYLRKDLERGVIKMRSLKRPFTIVSKISSNSAYGRDMLVFLGKKL